MEISYLYIPKKHEQMLNQETIDAAVKNLFNEIKFTQEPSGLYDPLRYMIEIGGKTNPPYLVSHGIFIIQGRVDTGDSGAGGGD